MNASPSLPARFAHRVRRLLARIPGGGGGAQCCLCGHRIGRFLPNRHGWSSAPPLLHALRVIGSDLDCFACPVCSSNDRERHLVFYFRQLGLLEKLRGKAVLHFAPEPQFSVLIAGAGPARYVRADLHPGEAGIERIDMLAIAHASATFDCVIANHVLEHVADDVRALAELHRVLRPGGFAVLQTPYSPMLERTIEDPGVDTAAARLQLYGQEDHARLYGRDIFARFVAAGFVDRVVGHEAALPAIDPVRHGVNREEPLFLFERR